MNGRRDEDDDVLAEPTDEELRAAGALREALSASPAGEALRAAFAPAALSHEAHERILEGALGEASGRSTSEGLAPLDLAPAPTAAEHRQAGALRARVDAGLLPDPDAEPDDEIERLVAVASALRAAHAPRVLDELSEARLRRAALSPARGGRRVVAALLAVAVAAAAAFAIVPRLGSGGAPATASLVRARSTQELFDPAEPFAREGGASARIDRIAASRSSDLRANRFARWGIR